MTVAASATRLPARPAAATAADVCQALKGFTRWLDRYGETSRDHQSFFAGPAGSRAKAVYYRYPVAGSVAVAPIIFLEAFLPSARRLFHRRIRFPIADAHYAMGFAFMYESTGDTAYLDRAVHFLEELKKSRCPGYDDYAWGYPFDWVTRGRTIVAQTPLITTTPYVYEAFLEVSRLRPRDEWHQILESIACHAARDFKDFMTSARGSHCSYTPHDSEPVVNAAAYRAFLLTSASRVLNRREYWTIAERNLHFVLEAQNPDGSWHYALDGRDFVDHFHTCFVMKALAKIHALTGNQACLQALSRGIGYYLDHLFDGDGRPRPFSKAPRLTVYRCELYDCAECINLCLLLRDRFPDLDRVLDSVVGWILREWIKPDGSFRSRRLLLGWDNVPMHRWGQSQMFRSLAFVLAAANEHRLAESRSPGDR